LPVGIRRHGLQKEPEATPHVEESARTPDDKSAEEIVMHSAASLVPIEVVSLCDFLAPKPVIVRGGCERREDMTAPTTAENVNAKLVENGAMLQLSTQQTLLGYHTLVNNLFRECSHNDR
jgi:hypothetical protein